MEIKKEYSAQDWAKLHVELSILSIGAPDMELQYYASLNLKRVKDTFTTYNEKREESIKKHGEKDKDSDNWSVKEKDDKGEELESYKAFKDEMKPINEAKSTLTLESFSKELIKGVNPRDFSRLFAQLGSPMGVFRFELVFDLLTEEHVK